MTLSISEINSLCSGLTILAKIIKQNPAEMDEMQEDYREVEKDYYNNKLSLGFEHRADGRV